MAIWDDVIPRAEQKIYEDGGWGGRVGFGRARPCWSWTCTPPSWILPIPSPVRAPGSPRG